MSLTSVKRSSVVGWIQRSLALTGLCVTFGFAAGCGSDTTHPATGPLTCKLNSDCSGALVCSFGLCHAECDKVKDCPATQRCVQVGGGDAGPLTKVCQLEQESICHHNSDCNSPLVCAVDLQCRNQCVTVRDCITGQECVSNVCANPDEVNADGTLKGAIDGGGGPGPGSGGGSGTGGGLSSGGNAPDASGTGGTDSGAGGTGTGGTLVGAGGNVVGTGGAGTGGDVGSGGTGTGGVGTGGVVGSGGAGTGGVGTGGAGTGGAGTGGAGTGGGGAIGRCRPVSTQCADTGTGVQTCSDDGLTWGTAKACAADTQTCIVGTCVPCPSGTQNCNGDATDGCEVNLDLTSSCGTTCANQVNCSGSNPTCLAGVCGQEITPSIARAISPWAISTSRAPRTSRPSRPLTRRASPAI